MSDGERLDKLEAFMRTSCGNGLAIFICNSATLFTIDDLGDEDWSDLGESLCTGVSLRDAIDNLKDSPDA